MERMYKPSQLSFELNTGAKIPAVGLGTWQSKPGEVGNAVKTAIKLGYRHIDCARIYENEKEVGLALKEVLQSDMVKREDLWITSKLWVSDCSPDKVPKAINSTLQDLQLDYIDLYLIHWPNNQIASTWEAMEKLLDTGKVRAIGVSNFSVKKLQDLIEHSKVIPAVNQAYSPLGSPGTGWLKSPVKVLEHPLVKQAADHLGKSPAQVALRWCLQSGCSVLPKSCKEERIKENFGIFEWSIPEELMGQLSQIEQVKFLRGEFLVDKQRGPFRSIEELWDGEI